jgi:hypothetical protein
VDPHLQELARWIHCFYRTSGDVSHAIIRKKNSRGDAGAAWDGGGCVQSVQSNRTVGERGNARTQCVLRLNTVETRNRLCFAYERRPEGKQTVFCI